MPNTKKSVVVWVRQELFQQRVCPAVDIDLIATYRVVDQLWKQSRNDVFSRDVLVQVCQDVLNLRKRKAALLFQGYKIMEAWAGFDKALQQRAESVAKPGENASHLGLVSLMAQFLFVRNYSIPPTATATDLKLQVESVYPSSGQSTSASNPRRAALNLKSHSWSSTMKLRQSSADQHCKYVLKNFKSLLRLVVRDLAEHPSFDEAVITEEEIDNFNFLFGCCVQEHPTEEQALLSLLVAGKGPMSVKAFETWMKEYMVSIPYGDNIQDHPSGKHAFVQTTDVPLKATPDNGRPLFIARKTDSSVFVDERHFPHADAPQPSDRQHALRGRAVTILQCSHTSVFIIAPVAFLRIVGCSNCKIFVSAARFNVTVENCEFCEVTATTRSVAVCNCVDTSLYMCTTTQPILSGDCRGIRLAPNGSFHHRDIPILTMARFPGLEAELNVGTEGHSSIQNHWNNPVDDDEASGRGGGTVIAGGSKPKGANWSILPVEDFVPALVPYHDGTSGFARKASSQDIERYPAWRRLPAPYASVTENRIAKTMALQSNIEAAGCSVEQVNDLQRYVQNEFAEWLHAEGHAVELHNWVKNLKKRK